MKSMTIAGLLLGLGMTFSIAPHATRADEDEAGRRPRVDPIREVMIPSRELTFDSKTQITEGPRMLGDQFPYLAATPRSVSSTSAVEIVPATLRSFLQAAPQKEGTAAARVATGQAAIDAVRLFLAGPVVRDASTAERIIETGRRLATRLEHLEVKVTTHRPESWAPRAWPVRRDGEPGPVGRWKVSLVAFELDRMLRLVHVNGWVTTEGAVEMKRTPIVDGPMTTWQTALDGVYTSDVQRRDAAMRAEAVAARRAYAEALRPARDLDAFWAIGRVLQDMDEVRALFGEPDRDIGSGIHIWVFDLTDGTSVVFGGSHKRVVYVRHVRGARRPMRGFQTLGTIYAGPGR